MNIDKLQAARAEFIALCQTDPEKAATEWQELRDMLHDCIMEQSQEPAPEPTEITCAADFAQWAKKFAALGDEYGLGSLIKSEFQPNDWMAFEVTYHRENGEELQYGARVSASEGFFSQISGMLNTQHKHTSMYLADLAEQGKITRKAQ